MRTAEDDRRHSKVIHLAKAISIRDFCDQVAQRYTEGTLIPSEEWLCLQFWPKTPKAKVSIHYTGRLNVCFIVQKQQFQMHHVDQHQAATVFHCM